MGSSTPTWYDRRASVLRLVNYLDTVGRAILVNKELDMNTWRFSVEIGKWHVLTLKEFLINLEINSSCVRQDLFSTLF